MTLQLARFASYRIKPAALGGHIRHYCEGRLRHEKRGRLEFESWTTGWRSEIKKRQRGRHTYDIFGSYDIKSSPPDSSTFPALQAHAKCRGQARGPGNARGTSFNVH